MKNNSLNVNMDHDPTFSAAVLAWFEQYGRKDLPWQQHPTAYRVWVSEIMLQQTQVSTVIDYYKNFMQHFPELMQLANAPLDSVLAQWSGLGYYARARHLHRAAQHIQLHHQGQFPDNFEQLIELPGIGRSTAGAILALAFKKAYPILDGNVKRVLCRVHAIDKPPHEVQNELWTLATQYMPQHHVAAYTQAMMDLGATVCTRSRPNCTQCPLQSRCLGKENPCLYPVPKAKKQLPVKQVIFLMLQHITTGMILLEQRPPQGIWGGLWSFPESSCIEALPKTCQQLGISISQYDTWATVRHTFTHFHLDIRPIHMMLTETQAKTIALSGKVWYNPHMPPQLGLAAPVNRLIQQLSPTFAPVQTCLL